MTSPQISIRKAVASEAERLADIALLAWERDLQPFLSGEAASRQNANPAPAAPEATA